MLVFLPLFPNPVAGLLELMECHWSVKCGCGEAKECSISQKIMAIDYFEFQMAQRFWWAAGICIYWGDGTICPRIVGNMTNISIGILRFRSCRGMSSLGRKGEVNYG